VLTGVKKIWIIPPNNDSAVHNAPLNKIAAQTFLIVVVQTVLSIQVPGTVLRGSTLVDWVRRTTGRYFKNWREFPLMVLHWSCIK
jgi:hypothetical protein